jgi:acetyl esterase/lipase
MSRPILYLKVFILRIVQSILTLLDLYLSHPGPRIVSFTRQITSTVGSVPGSFKLLFYTPILYSKDASATTKKHPLVINFHGGGFTVGHARDDGRWATTVTSQTNAFVVSVEYRLAPEYPFPVGIEDCVSAVLWLWKHADEYNLDIERTAFSGFSAGGNFVYAVSIRLHAELEKLKKHDKLDGIEVGKVVSLVSFYGSVDNTRSRAERNASNPNLIPVIPLPVFKIFDDSYLSSKPDMSSPLLSPGLAPDEVLQRALPDNLVMINCGGDQLLVESEDFRKRLIGLGKKVSGCIIEGVGHAWDKKPTFKKGDVKRDKAYGFAVENLQRAWA